VSHVDASETSRLSLNSVLRFPRLTPLFFYLSWLESFNGRTNQKKIHAMVFFHVGNVNERWRGWIVKCDREHRGDDSRSLGDNHSQGRSAGSTWAMELSRGRGRGRSSPGGGAVDLSTRCVSWIERPQSSIQGWDTDAVGNKWRRWLLVTH